MTITADIEIHTAKYKYDPCCLRRAKKCRQLEGVEIYFHVSCMFSGENLPLSVLWTCIACGVTTSVILSRILIWFQNSNVLMNEISWRDILQES
jgi:hypothetical protein